MITKELKFYKKLENALANFDEDSATWLSIEIHEAEEAGYEISDAENELWYQLTSRIVNDWIDEDVA